MPLPLPPLTSRDSPFSQLSLAEFKHAIKMWMHHPDLTAHHEKSLAMVCTL